jgi:putative protease
VSPDGAGWRLTFGNPGPDLSKVRPGHRVWVNSDPALESETRRLLQMAVTGRVPVDVTVSGRLGEPLRATFSSGRCTVLGETSSALVSSSGAGLDAAQLEGKLAAFGGTRFHLQVLTTDLEAGLFIPPQAMKALRRELVEQLERLLDAPPERILPDEPMVPALRKRLRDAAARSLDFRAITSLAPPMKRSEPEPIALCRLPEQLEAAIALGLREVELDWMEMVGLGLAVERAKSAGMKVVVATTRVQKPGEEGFDKRIAKLAPDGVLARHWGALMHFSRKSDDIRPIVHGDFSLNVTNSLTALHLLGLGADTLTASHDLDEAQLLALLSEVPAHLVTVVLHHHIPTFHTEHCVYAHTLSDGTDYRNCGRPCEHRRVSLVDPKGLSHPVITDVGCRNTVFEARAQSAASLTPRLLEAGVERFRVELVRETFDETKTVLETYRALLRGEISPREAVRRVGVHEQFGVVRGVARSVVHAP